MRVFLFISALFLSSGTFGQSANEKRIRHLLQQQVVAWNNGDIEAFMQPYWKNDSLMFIGSKGVVWGWHQTLENYKKGYPDKAAMGTLSFDIIQVRRLARNVYFVVGKWMLARSAGDLSGHYTLVLEKKKGQWVIVSDHSS